MRIGVVADVKPLLGEGPVWDAESERLYFIDSLGQRIFRCTEPAEKCAPGPRRVRSDRWHCAARAVRSWRCETDSMPSISQRARSQLLVDPEPGLPGNRLNDGKVDPAGRFVCGSMDCGEAAPTGALWQLDPDLSLRRLDSDIICSNGPCWSPDGGTLYFADSFRGTIFAYDYDPVTGDAGGRRPFALTDPSRGGAPDGATVDAEGYVWSCAVFDGRIFRYSPDGERGRDHRDAGSQDHQPDLRRTAPRPAVRHLYGRATASEISRRRTAEGQPFRH